MCAQNNIYDSNSIPAVESVLSSRRHISATESLHSKSLRAESGSRERWLMEILVHVSASQCSADTDGQETPQDTTYLVP